MKGLFSRLLLAPLAALVLASFVITTTAEAAGGRGGGGGGGGARAGGGAQANNTRADARTNDVRSTSVNNVNVNKNVNVNVDVDNHHGIGGWDHPVAGAMVVGGAIAVTAAAVGSMVATVPATCVPINYGGAVYQQCGTTWYAPQGSQFVVVNPPY